jgi:hypothetical protein
MKEFEKRMRFEMRPSTSFHQQCNGKVENKVKMVKGLLHSLLLKGVSFRKALLETQKIANNYVVSDTTGFTPFQIINGEPFQDDVDRLVKKWMDEKSKVVQEAKSNMEKKKMVQKKYYDKGKNNRYLEVGDKVLFENHYYSTFLDQKRIGPFEVERVYDRDNYLISDGRSYYRKVNIQYLKKYTAEPLLEIPAPTNLNAPVAPSLSQPIIVARPDPDPIVAVDPAPAPIIPVEPAIELVNEPNIVPEVGVLDADDVPDREPEVGEFIEIYWSEEDAGPGKEGFYRGKVEGLAKKGQKRYGTHTIAYDDRPGEKSVLEKLVGDGHAIWRFSKRHDDDTD